MIAYRIENFKPSINGFHFANNFPPSPVFEIDLPAGIKIPIGTAEGGMCGGMVYAAKEIFGMGQQIPNMKEPPEFGSSWFKAIAKYLIISFDGLPGVMKYIEWQRKPTEEPLTGLNYYSRAEIHQILPKLMDNQLVGLGVIKVLSNNPFDIVKNHQVLVYGLDYNEGSDECDILIYDPNYPDDDDCKINIDMKNEKVHYERDENTRGFFANSW